MPDIMEDYKHLDGWDDNKLFGRQSELKNSGLAMKDLSDETLQELLAINRVLRRRAHAPKPKASTRAAAPTLGQL